MGKEITYKPQGDGRDSWVIEETDEKGTIIDKYMVYENPNTENKGGLHKMILSATEEEINEIKKILGL